MEIQNIFLSFITTTKTDEFKKIRSIIEGIVTTYTFSKNCTLNIFTPLNDTTKMVVFLITIRGKDNHISDNAVQIIKDEIQAEYSKSVNTLFKYI